MISSVSPRETYANSGENTEMSKAQFEAAVAVAYECGRMIHSDLQLTSEAYGSHLESIVIHYLGSGASWAAATQFVMELHTSDLYLSIACAAKSEDAWRRFRSLYFRFLSEVFWYVNRLEKFRERFGGQLIERHVSP